MIHIIHSSYHGTKIADQPVLEVCERMERRPIAATGALHVARWNHRRPAASTRDERGVTRIYSPRSIGNSQRSVTCKVRDSLAERFVQASHSWIVVDHGDPRSAGLLRSAGDEKREATGTTTLMNLTHFFGATRESEEDPLYRKNRAPR